MVVVVVRWMRGVGLEELRERLGVDDIARVLQQSALHWYGHVLRSEDGDWVKKCVECGVGGPGPGGGARGAGQRLYRRTVGHVR